MSTSAFRHRSSSMMARFSRRKASRSDDSVNAWTQNDRCITIVGKYENVALLLSIIHEIDEGV